MDENIKDLITEIYLDHFKEIYQRSEPELVNEIHNVVQENADHISELYFDLLLSAEGNDNLFNKETIESDVKLGFKNWLNKLFIYQDSDEQIIEFIHYQLQVGRKFVRMNMPSHLLNLGTRFLKMQLCKLITDDSRSVRKTHDTFIQITMVIDTCMSITMEAYLYDRLMNERRSQALLNHIAGAELAEACQTVRADLYGWHTNFLSTMLRPGNIVRTALPAISQAPFALWVRHKAKVIFHESEDVAGIDNEINVIENKLDSIVEYKNKQEMDAFLAIVQEIENSVNRIAFFLASLTEHAHTSETCRDPLTKLYSRRYLDIILQKETNLALTNNSPYMLLMLDVDDFKQVNDTHGHPEGDKVIQNIADLINESVRATDYVFRYGGDEFLILLVNAKKDRAEELATEIILKVGNHSAPSANDTNKAISATSISIGIAEFTGSLDYNSVIKKADTALMSAKRKGKNMYAVS